MLADEGEESMVEDMSYELLPVFPSCCHSSFVHDHHFPCRVETPSHVYGCARRIMQHFSIETDHQLHLYMFISGLSVGCSSPQLCSISIVLPPLWSLVLTYLDR